MDGPFFQDSALLMVLLGTVFELTCSPVLFAAISRTGFLRASDGEEGS